MNWALLQNSLLLAALTTLLATGLGFMAALWMAGVESRLRNGLLAAAVAALALPPFLATNCWLHYLGLTGVWRAWLPLNIYSLGGAIWILTLLTWPITLLAVLAAWKRIQPSQLESDPALKGVALIRWLLWPMARNAVSLAAVLTFVLALNNFAVPAILQVKVFPAELWVKFETNRRFAETLALSWPLVLAPLALLVCLRGPAMNWPRDEGQLAAQAIRQQLGVPCSWLSAALTTLALIFSVGLPLAHLVASTSTWNELPNLLRATPGAIGNSFALAAVTASICVALGWAAWRLPVGPLLWLPFLVPGVLLGLAMIYLFNRKPFDVIYPSAAMVALAFTIRYAGFGWNGAANAFRAMDRDLADAARLHGASGWLLFRHAYWPQIAPQTAGAWYVTYLLCLWDVETLVLIVPPGGETLSLRIFNLLHYGHHAQVNAMCLMLLALALAPLVIWNLGRWAWAKVARL